MSLASHAVKRLHDLYRVVLIRMRAMNERGALGSLAMPSARSLGRMEQLESRLLLAGANAVQSLFPVAAYPLTSPGYALACGDLNGDGAADLVVGQFGASSATVMLGNGDGTFSAGVSVALPDDAAAVALGDATGDGKLDLIAGQFSQDLGEAGAVCVLPGHGDGTFGAAVTTPVDNAIWRMVARDFDGDGKADIAFVDMTDQSVLYMHSTGGGHFASPVEIGSSYSTAIAAADVTGDGRPDVVVISTDGVDVIAYNGGGVFAPASTIAFDGSIDDLAVGDMTGDGKADIVAIGSADSENVLWVIPNAAGGDFQTPKTYASGVDDTALALGDVGGRGHLDVVALGHDNDLSVIPGTGDGRLMPPRVQAGLDVPSQPLLVDVNGDGRADLVALDGQNVVVMLSQGQDLVGGQCVDVNGDELGAMRSADVNGDGRSDLLTITTSSGGLSTLWVYLGNSQGGFDFAAKARAGDGMEISTLATGDLNNDGNLDVVTADLNAHRVSILLGDGSGAFTSAGDAMVGATPMTVELADFNGDGVLDIVTANQDSSDLSVLIGNGDGTFRPRLRLDPGLDVDESLESVAVGDINSDGLPDIVAGSFGQVAVFFNDGQGGFLPAVDTFVSADAAQLAVADVNGDSRPELVMGGGIGVTIIPVGSDGQLGAPWTPGVLSDIKALTVGDVTGDGIADVVAISQEGARVFTTDGAGRMLMSVFGLAGTGMAVALADVNQDGRLDVLAGLEGQAKMEVLPNGGSTRITSTPSGLVGGPVSAIDLFFPQAMDTGSFSPQADIVSFIGPNGAIAVTGFSWMNAHRLQVRFAPQHSLGQYRMVLGPAILTAQGAAMEADGDGTPGEVSDTYLARFEITPPQVVAIQAGDGSANPVSWIRVSFDRPMDTTSFSLAQDVLSFTGPSGAVTAKSFAWLDNQTLEVRFDPQARAGDYQMRLGPQVLDPNGVALDGNGDGTPGEAADGVSVSWHVSGPRVTEMTPDVKMPQLSVLIFQFDRAMNTGSFAAAQDLTITGPGGTVSGIMAIWPDPDRLALVIQPAPSTPGTYHVVLGPNVTDAGGNQMEQFTADVEIGDITPPPPPVISYNWGPENGPIVIDGGFQVPADQTLTIQAGTIVKFESGGLEIAGSLKVLGTAQQPVIFTSINDDSVGGDTNKDGDETGAGQRDWDGIDLGDDGASVDMQYAQVRYAASGIDLNSDSTVDISHALFSQNEVALYGWSVYSHFSITDSLVVRNKQAMEFGSTTYVTIRNCTIVDNGLAGHIGHPILEMDNSIVAYNGVGFTGWPDAVDLDVKNSIFYDDPSDLPTWVAADFAAKGNLAADPLLVDYQTGNYELAPASPAIDSGEGDSASTTDAFGRSRRDDMGVANTGTGTPNYIDRGALERQDQTLGVDLAVTVLRDPAGTVLSARDKLTVRWTVGNLGILDAAGAWNDAVYLAANPYPSPNDVPLGTVAHAGGLAAGDTYAQSLTATMPNVAGVYYILVRTNADSGVSGDAFTADDTKVSSIAVAVNLPVLAIGGTVDGTVVAGEWSFVRFHATAGQAVNIALSGPAASGAGLYVRHGVAPTTAAYELDGSAVAGGQLLRWHPTRTADYYICIYGGSAGGAFTVSAALPTLGIRAVSPSHLAKATAATIRIDGDGFAPGGQVKLIGAGGAIIPGQELFQDAGTLFATFDLSGAALGTYDVVVSNGGVTQVTAAKAVTVEAVSQPQLVATLTVPGLTRPARVVDVRIDISNPGTTQVPSPVLTLEADADDCQWQLAEQDTWETGSRFEVLGLSSDGPSTVLLPGQSESIIVKLRIPFRPDPVNLTLSSMGSTPDDGSAQAIDWTALSAQLRPEDVSDASWSPVLAHLQSQLGTTWGDYADALRADADTLALAGVRQRDARELLNMELDKAYGLPTGIVAGQALLPNGEFVPAGTTISATCAAAGVYAQATVGDEGRFVIQGLASGNCSLAIDGYFITQGRDVILPAGGLLTNASVTASEAAHVEGHVVSAIGGAALSGATVLLLDADGNELASATTDMAGLFTFPQLAAGTYTFSASLAGALPGSLSVDVESGATSYPRLALTPGASIAGIVRLGNDHSALAGANIVAIGQDTNYQAIVRSAADGTYRFTGLPADRYIVTAQAADLAPQSLPAIALTAGQSRSGANFSMEQGASVSGQVLSSGGLPIAGAQVSVYGDGFGPKVAIADAQGHYTIAGIPAGQWFVQASHPDYVALAGTQVLFPSSGTLTKDITLAPGATVAGLVTDGAGQPVVGAALTAAGPNNSFAQAVTDADGHYALSGLASGTHRVQIESAGKAWQEVSLNLVAGAPAVTQNFQLQGGRIAQGVVSQGDGTPIVGALVTFSGNLGQETAWTSDDNGAFTGDTLTPGVYIVTVEAAGYCSLQTVIDVPAQGDIAGLTLTLSHGASITGIVKNADGSAVSGGEVRAIPASGGQTLSATTADDGSYSFAQLPGGSYTVVALGSDSGGQSFAGQTLVLADGDAAVADFTAATAKVHGTVRSGGAALGGATVTAILTSGQRLTLETLTAADGTYNFPSMLGGDYLITVAADGLGRATANVTVASGGDAAADINMASQVTLTGAITDGASGQPIAHAIVQLWQSAAGDSDPGLSAVTDASGEYSIAGLAPGDYTMRIFTVDHPVYEAAVTVAQDATRDVALSAAGRALTVELTDAATGKPLGLAGGLIYREGMAAGYFVTDAGGVAHLTVSEGVYSLEGISPVAFTSAQFAVAGDATRQVSVTLGEGVDPASQTDPLAIAAPTSAPTMRAFLGGSSGGGGGGSGKGNSTWICPHFNTEAGCLARAYILMAVAFSSNMEISACHMGAFLNKVFETVYHSNDFAVAKIKASSMWQDFDDCLRTKAVWFGPHHEETYYFDRTDGKDIAKQWLAGDDPTSWSISKGYNSMFHALLEYPDLTEGYGGINRVGIKLSDITVDLDGYEVVSNSGQYYFRFPISASGMYTLYDTWKLYQGKEEGLLGVACLDTCFGYAEDNTETYVDQDSFDTFGRVPAYTVKIEQTHGGTVELESYEKGKQQQQGDDEWLFTEDTHVKFRATPEDDYELVGWHFGPDFDVNSDQTVSAEFKKKEKEPDHPLKPQDKKKIDVQTSWSPEDKWGPAGYDAPGTPTDQLKHYIQPGLDDNYRIEIWNKPDALVPTQKAEILDTLDPNLFDLSTFNFTRVGFLKYDMPLAGGQDISVRIDPRPELNFAVDVTATLDAQGHVRWVFQTVDPLTGDYPSDPYAGFLPPYNPATGYEIGWMEFTVKPKADLPTGTTLHNQASVMFDDHLPWGLAPKAGPWINTIDADPPSSSVTVLPADTWGGDFRVSWSGTDGAGSGVVGYDVYSSEDGGVYSLWQGGTTATSAVFHGRVDHSYSFYSVARDGVGYVEAPPASADTTTLVHPFKEKKLTAKTPVTFTDSGGRTVTISLGGKTASGTVYLAGDDHVDARMIVLDQTDAKTSLTILTKGTGRTSIGSITVHGSMGGITGKTANLAGDLTVEGSLGSLTMGDAAEATISIGPRSAGDIKTATTLTLDRVAEVSIDSLTPLNSLTVTEWIDADGTADVIHAASVAKLAAKGDKKRALAGDFEAGLDLTGGVAKGLTLGSATIAGGLCGANWNIRGLAGAITVTGTAGGAAAGEGLTVRADGGIGAITLGSSIGADFLAGTTPAAAGDAAITRRADDEGDFNAPAAIKSVTIKPGKNQPGPAFADSNFSAASIGAVAIVNVKTNNDQAGLTDAQDDFGFWSLAIKSVKRSEPTDPKNKSTNWTWTPKSPALPPLLDDLSISPL